MTLELPEDFHGNDQVCPTSNVKFCSNFQRSDFALRYQDIIWARLS